MTRGNKTDSNNALGHPSSCLAGCRVAPEFLTGTKKDAAYDLDDCPLIVFINARSGGRVGPELANKLARALGRSQVCLQAPAECPSRMVQSFS